jgi:signal peptidase II
VAGTGDLIAVAVCIGLSGGPSVTPLTVSCMRGCRFLSFHAFGYEWYVFNIADTAIVAGVIGLLYESVFGGHKKVSNPSKM